MMVVYNVSAQKSRYIWKSGYNAEIRILGADWGLQATFEFSDVHYLLDFL